MENDPNAPDSNQATPGIRRHNSHVLGREILILNVRDLTIARKNMSVIQEEDMCFLQSEIDKMKYMEEDSIRFIGLMKSIFPDCLVK